VRAWLEYTIKRGGKLREEVGRGAFTKLVENFFDSISLQSAEMSAMPQYSALVQELAGIITLPTDFDEKQEYESYLRKKYE